MSLTCFLVQAITYRRAAGTIIVHQPPVRDIEVDGIGQIVVGLRKHTFVNIMLSEMPRSRIGIGIYLAVVILP